MTLSTGSQSLNLVKLALYSIILYAIYKVIQRLFFHPLSRVPGPWYAAVSTLYEFWWDGPKEGKYMFKIEEMHEKYGPIVRINPWEVHIDDPAFMDVLLTNNRMEKDPFFYGGFGIPNAAVSTVSPEVHKLRRGAMAQFFSKANVAKLEPRVLSRIQQLCKRIEEHKKEGKPVDISNAYRCFATDIVTDFAVPKTRNFLDHPTFNAVFNRVVRDTAGVINWNRHIRFLYPLMVNIPRSIVTLLDKDGSTLAMVDNQQDLYDQAKAVVESTNPKPTPTVMDVLFKHPSLPPKEKTLSRMFGEVVTVIGAGTETTGCTLAVLTYYVLSTPSIFRTLKAELDKAAATHNISRTQLLDCHAVEPLPYLQAVMKESLRVASPVVGRLPRRLPGASMTYTTPSGQTYVLPPGTTASMSVRDIHFNRTIFADPHTFKPERWLTKDAAELARLDKHMVAFGKGVRQCLGLELAKQEILLVAANLFWKFDFELFETTARDVSVEFDFFAPFGPSDSKGVRVRVRE
ncbi:putative benzoate 4-monooxygenase cytochrome P450 [Massariosphaeria phaeospora]|uniref:Putative benzoate 4-monooxygenase cytochrome P450 n=1 Tax=Massariosphaeria phaeospora TaxID=100035 RepID=A0A7C8MHT2_9PLEO|nr:putative benzoate 4-monooxygenase cytochrome P450 [Massariosphaeria phaeospora]